MPIWSRLLFGLHIWLVESLAMRSLGSRLTPDPGAILGNLLRTCVTAGLRLPDMPGRAFAGAFLNFAGRNRRVFARAFLTTFFALGAAAGASIGSHSKSA
jgi:hypothetical protein